MNPRAHYQAVIANTPPAGTGNDFHSLHLMRAANAAARDRIPFDQFVTDVWAIDHKRHVPYREITDAYNKASGDMQTGTFASTPKPPAALSSGPTVFGKYVDQGKGVEEADFHDASPIRLTWEPKEDASRLLCYLYDRTDRVFIGHHDGPGIVDDTIRPVIHWGIRFDSGCTTYPHIIPNPLSGLPAPKKSGDGETYRGDNNVSSFRFCTVEFDGLSHAEQFAFWAAVDLPISALIDSGGRSIHAWLDVRQLASVSTLEEWELHIGKRLYDQVLIPLGVDAACKNASRLSRLPGHFRTEKQKWQRILYLSPEGRKVF